MSTIDILLALRLHGDKPCEKVEKWLRSLPAEVTLQEVWDLCPQGDWSCWWAEAAGEPITRAEIWQAILPEIREPYLAWARGTEHERLLDLVEAAIASGDADALRAAEAAADAAWAAAWAAAGATAHQRIATRIRAVRPTPPANKLPHRSTP